MGSAKSEVGSVRPPVSVQAGRKGEGASPSVPMTRFAPPASLLRLLTCGSVDDGKSTLIGRLLYDCRAVFADQLAAVETASKRRGGEVIDLSLFTDGLRWEREQGITIDVAYRYFSTATRRFILIDCPGHAQYTRNMVTGASHADLAVILIDARHGVKEQTRRHAYVAAMLGIPELVVAVNKMDLVGWDRSIFESIKADFEKLRPHLHGARASYVPVSALNGDNIVSVSDKTPWHDGSTILSLLEAAQTEARDSVGPARFPVQCIIRPRGRDEREHDFRGYAGQVASGAFRVGDRVRSMASGQESVIQEIRILDARLAECRAHQSVVMTLRDELDIGRGDLLCRADAARPPTAATEFDADIVWMGAQPMGNGGGKRYLLRHTTRFTPALVSAPESVVDLDTLQPKAGVQMLAPNDIGRVRIRCATEVFVDGYDACKATGSFVLIDSATCETVGAGLIRSETDGCPK